jgi:hypothetical protein
MPWPHRRIRGDYRLPSFLLIALATLAVVGCHSANVYATIANRTARQISLIQVEYPSASFGKQTLAAGQTFKYRFKVLGSGQVKITYNDSSNHEHKSIGPTLSEGTDGTLAIDIAADGVHWTLRPTAKSKH